MSKSNNVILGNLIEEMMSVNNLFLFFSPFYLFIFFGFVLVFVLFWGFCVISDFI